MRLTVTSLAAAVVLIVAAPAHAGLKHDLHRQQARYYHAVGYLTAIGHMSYRTILAIDPVARLRWSAEVNTLISERDDARRRIARLRHAILLAAWPPHHALWLCISGGEGGIRSINPNGHYGMLQMHAGWGYGTSYHASDDSQMVQEWAAERAYKKSGYSYAWLYGQWAADAHCF